MSEAIIAKRYSKSSSSGGSGTEPSHLVTEVIVENTNWTVPSGINGNKVSVRLFGGGGGGGSKAGGGGGWMNNGDITVQEGQIISIRIGKGGTSSRSSGGTTSFGTYLSASGGSAPNSTHAGSGGSGGGSSITNINGGKGYQFGGGGVCIARLNPNTAKIIKAGDGGTYGVSYGDGGDGICIIQYYAKS